MLTSVAPQIDSFWLALEANAERLGQRDELIDLLVRNPKIIRQMRDVIRCGLRRKSFWQELDPKTIQGFALCGLSAQKILSAGLEAVPHSPTMLGR